jgi:hypothetical protein
MLDDELSIHPAMEGEIQDPQTDFVKHSLKISTGPEQRSIPGHIIPNLDRCLALTKKGVRCKNQPIPGSQYCRVHAMGINKESE